MTSPFISVIMPVYNGVKHLNEALESILNQTFTDFEFIILNDGSSDASEEVILSYDDKRIRYVNNKENLKIVKTLNKGIKLAKGQYIARMDADDVALPHRLATQLEYMWRHPEVTICGSYLQIYEQPSKIWKVPIIDEAIKVRLLFNSCLYHPTVFFKKEIFLDYSYESSFLGTEDYDLWQRLSQNPNIHFANIPEVLLLYRVHPNEDKSSYKAKQRMLANLIRDRQLKNLGFEVTNQTLLLHEAFSSNSVLSLQWNNLKQYQQWLVQVELANVQAKVYPTAYLKKELEYRWLNLCTRVAPQHPLVAFKFLFSSFSPNTLDSLYRSMKIFRKSCKRKY